MLGLPVVLLVAAASCYPLDQAGEGSMSSWPGPAIQVFNELPPHTLGDVLRRAEIM